MKPSRPSHDSTRVRFTKFCVIVLRKWNEGPLHNANPHVNDAFNFSTFVAPTKDI
jgi:hypothetical protein